MTNPLQYWPHDPSGFLRHTLVGIAFACLHGLTGWRGTLAALLVLAVGKEGYDYAVKGLWQWEDIIYTMVGYLPALIKKRK